MIRTLRQTSAVYCPDSIPIATGPGLGNAYGCSDWLQALKIRSEINSLR